MAKSTFASGTWKSRTWASGTWQGEVVPTPVRGPLFGPGDIAERIWRRKAKKKSDEDEAELERQQAERERSHRMRIITDDQELLELFS